MRTLAGLLMEKPSQKHVYLPADTYNLNGLGNWREDLRGYVCTALDVLNDHAAHGVGCGERFGALIPPMARL